MADPASSVLPLLKFRLPNEESALLPGVANPAIPPIGLRALKASRFAENARQIFSDVDFLAPRRRPVGDRFHSHLLDRGAEDSKNEHLLRFVGFDFNFTPSGTVPSAAKDEKFLG